ncbi:MAG TPA: TetR/AcrR family transcriptional regulator [Myxococcales bacterium]|nr:TetR/AcrR family transcriptional regulator [Myxococcales bacterium]
MSYPPGHRERTRERIVRSAQVLFNRHGFDAVSIDAIMAHAGLTRGGFYKYFAKKSDLYTEAVGLALRDPPSNRWPGQSVDFGAADAARQVIRAYLSREHFENVDASCPMVAIPSDVARSDPAVKRVFEDVFKAMVELFRQGMRRKAAGDRQRALVMAGICVGGMVVARGLADRKFADSLRSAAMAFALGLGRWPGGHAGIPVRRSPRRHRIASR